MKNSLHDWNRPANSRSIAESGSCSACHDIHLPSQTTASYVGTWFTSANLWGRSLSLDLAEYYQKRDLNRTSGSPNNDGPNYLVGATILCYDCHGGDARKGPAGDPFVPDDSDFALTDSPQDIAFAGDQDTPAFNDGSNVGYYELPDGYSPDNIAHKAPTLSAVMNSGEVPGGHYVKSIMANGNTEDNYEVRDPDNNLLYRISVGDKLPCALCHDPHWGDVTVNDDEVFFRRNIYAGENTIVNRTEELGVQNTSLQASSVSRNGNGNGRILCQYCHGTADWWNDQSQNPTNGSIPPLIVNWTDKITIYGIQIRTTANTGGSPAFPPPLGPPEHESTDTTTPCTNCHQHNNINASCGGCHDFPPTTGAHPVHAGTANGKPEFNCETCHGPNPGSASWHNESSASPYDPDVNYGNITLMPSLSTTEQGVQASYYNSTWTRSSVDPAFAPTVTKAAGYAFECTNVVCHGMDTVNWTWTANESSVGGTSSEAGYRLCGGCHGMAADIDGDGDLDPQRTGVIDVASFRSRSGTLYQATNAAANYLKPVSCYSRGGHGDVDIYTESPFIESAPGSGIPVACGSCHDGTVSHFPVASSNPYRMKSATGLPGYDSSESLVTNMCTQSNCHPKTRTGDEYAALKPAENQNQAAHRHGVDLYPFPPSGDPLPKLYYLSVGSKPVILSQPPASSTTDPRYNPAGITDTVGIHIDRYVDHWAWWGNSATTDTGDDQPFMPLGDSLLKTSGGSFNNQADSTDGLVTCITCHNPHGTDLFVFGETPDSSCASTFSAIPDNNMLRLRWSEGSDNEVCSACH